MFRDIIDHYSVIVEVNHELRGFTIFTKSSLSLQFFNISNNELCLLKQLKFQIPKVAKRLGLVKHLKCLSNMYVASITNGTTDRQDKYLVSLISTWVALHFNSECRTIIYQSVSENV